MRIKRSLLLFLVLCCWLVIRAQDFVFMNWNTLHIDSLLPVYTQVIPLGEDYDRYTYRVELEYPDFAILTKDETERVRRISPELPELPQAEIHLGVTRRKGQLDVSFVPLVKRGGQYMKLLNCKLALYKTLKKTTASKTRQQVGTTISRYASSSVLSKGKWVKISVSEEGVYQLTPAALAKMGFSNPNRVKLYGYGGHLQKLVIDADTDYDDLNEVPLYKGKNGLLFYANGLTSWSKPVYNATTGKYISSHTTNHYSNYAYYFLTEGDEPMPFPKKQTPSGGNVKLVSSFPERLLYEKDAYAWFQGGSRLFDPYNYATGNSQTYRLPTVNPVSDEGGALTVAFTNGSAKPISVVPEVDGTTLAPLSVSGTAEYIFARLGTRNYNIKTLKEGNSGTVVKLTTTAGYDARLDYLELNYTRRLELSGAAYLPFSHYLNGTVQFNIKASLAQSLSIWQLGTSEETICELEKTQTGSECAVLTNDATRRFVAVDVNASFPSPTFVQTIKNQNLHGIDSVVDMVIIVPASDKITAQAERLANAHRMLDKMKVAVVRADQIYNEFSSGTPDATAYRRFLKMLYDRAQTMDDAPRYLLLFGDGAWDNRMLSSAWRGYNPDDFLLCFESDDSYSEITCYVMEDYFGLLDDGEGTNLLREKVDLGVGRITVQTTEEAKTVVDKTISYMKNVQAGAWKNMICMMADDGSNEKRDGNVHMTSAEEVAQSIEKNYPQYQVERVYWDAFAREAGATGFSYPLAAQKIKERMEEGALIMNYSGHGAPYTLSPENVITLEDVKRFNSPRVPIWITATCDAVPFDSKVDNIGEACLLNKQGASVAFYGTTRTVYSPQNKMMNLYFTKYVLGKDEKGKRNRLGDAVRLAKTSLVTPGSGMTDYSENKLHYVLLGDPALALGAPTYRVVVDSINGKSIKEYTEWPTLLAGSIVSFSGHVEDDFGNHAPEFTGKLTTTTYDSKTLVTCLNNAQVDVGAFTYYDRTRMLFTGNDSVLSGKFSVTFPIPLDINYSDDKGRVSFYAINNTGTLEANGYSENFYIGGTVQDMGSDTEGPKITAYLNKEDFENGGNVNASPYLVASLSDQSGINTAGSGVGHDLELIINDDPRTTYNLNEHYVNEFGDYRKGTVAFTIPMLPKGKHTLKLRAWDVFNNSSLYTLDFNVVEDMTPVLADVTCTENPAKAQTTFLLRYDRPGSTCEFTIEVFDFAGRKLWVHTESGVSANGFYSVPWNLTTGGGMPLSTGVYLYRASVSSDGSKESTKTKKIVIVRNK